MPSNNKRAAQVVVRPLAQGSRSAGKVVIGTMAELNRHTAGPLDDGRPKPEPKPWKQASRSYPRFRAGKVLTRRNAGRDDGRTWMAGRYVCGAGIEGESSDRDGEDEEDEGDSFMEEEGGRSGRAEVAIVDIAKPMKPRGATRDYEVVDTVRRVIVLEDDSEWEWEGDVEDDPWEPIEETAAGRVSYATILQRQAS